MDYIVAAVGDWNRKLFDQHSEKLQGDWHFASTPSELDELLATGIVARYLFFPHWRWIVPKKLTENYECVCFHMTDVPYGRGGSPLQNLIVRGHKETKLTALKMDEGTDTGPIYQKRSMSLAGRAEEIYQRAAELSWEMIEDIIEKQPTPHAQKGEVTEFKRRTPEQSEIPDGLSIEQVYDFIRMLDAPGYPRAFLENQSYRIEFENAVTEQGILKAHVNIKLKDSK